MAHSDGEGVVVLVTQKQWEKMRHLIHELAEEIWNTGTMSHKWLESDGGFLIYVVRTYTWMHLYLKGFFLTLNSWHLGRDEEGWQLPRKEEWELAKWVMEQGVEREWPPTPSQMPSAPTVLMPVLQLIEDLKALEVLTAPEVPPVCYMQTKCIYNAFYGSGDASGSGFGGAVPTQ